MKLNFFFRFPASSDLQPPGASAWNVFSGIKTDILQELDIVIAITADRILVFVCIIHVLPRSVRPNALRVLGNVAHRRVHQLTHHRVLGRVFPNGDEHEDDDVVLGLIETENVTTVVDTVLGSDVGDGLIFCQQESVRRVLVGGFVDVLNDFVHLSQDRRRGFKNQASVDVAEASGKVELAREIVQGCDTERSTTWKGVTDFIKSKAGKGRGKGIRVSRIIGRIIILFFGCVAGILV